MSKDITIQEGGTARAFTGVTKLKTAQAGGGSVYWVPEGETQLGHKSISADGTYYAADDGYYGFEYVVVNGITGKDPNADDDDDHNITVDPETGGLVNTRLPASIAITTEPTKSIYVDGESIDLTGIVVKAYYEDGTEWGTVTFSELLHDPLEADVSQVSADGKYSYPAIDTDGWCPQPIGAHLGNASQHNGETTFETTGYFAVLLHADYDSSVNVVLFCSTTYNTPWKVGFQQGTPWPYESVGNTTDSYTYDGKTAYFYRYNIGMSLENDFTAPGAVNHTTTESGLDVAKVAWIILFGNQDQIAGAQTITVSWARPGDGKILTTSFGVTVVDAVT